jgi:uncharacterized protein YneF (UPF0154 family)
LSFLLTIEGMLTTAFVAGLVLGFFLPRHWKATGWVLAGLAGLFAAIRLAEQQSTQATDILFAALWAAIGAFPGAALGSWIARRLRRSV